MATETPAIRLVEHLQQRGIRDRRVLDALLNVPRDQFVPPELHDDAWADVALPIGLEQTISQPMVVAWMTELLELTGDEIVLEIGTGSGYQTAVLARLARRVVTVERLEELSRAAAERLGTLGFDNVEYCVGDGTLGWPSRAPYDGIIVTAGAPQLPTPLYDQLKPNGRLVIPIGDAVQQEMQRVRPGADGPRVEDHGGCRFVPLIGAAGWTSAP